MPPPSAPEPLDLRSLGLLNYIHSLLAQPTGEWRGFYLPQSPSMNFAVRYQLAFGAYALALMSERTPAYRAPYSRGISGAIEKMLDVASWGYWRAPEPERAQPAELARSGHAAVLLSPHARVAAGPPTDPVARDNLQFSGHLSTMLGLYERLSGSERFDSPFTMTDPESGASFTYTHSLVAGRIHAQMLENPVGGVYCESGIAYVPCNNHALTSNALHDALHGTDFSLANARWLRSVRAKMVLKGPALRGIFAVCYLKDLHAGAPLAFNFTDAWGLAFLLPFDRPLVRRLYGRLKRRINRDKDGAYLPSSTLSERLEVSDVAINSGFASIVAAAMDDTSLYRELWSYADKRFDAGWQGSRFALWGAARTLHASALFGLAGALDRGGRNFAAMFSPSPRPGRSPEPLLAEVASEEGEGSIGVSQAFYSPERRSLFIALRMLGDPAQVRTGPALSTRLLLEGVPADAALELHGSPAQELGRRAVDGALEVSVRVPPEGEVRLEARLD